MTKTSWARLRAEVGGKALLSINGYVVLATLTFISSMLSVADWSKADAHFWWLVNLISLAACFVWFEVFNRGFFRNRATKPIALGWIAIFGLGLGAIKGLSTGFFAVSFGLEGNLQLAVESRIIQVSLFGLFGAFGLALIEATLQRYQIERDLLVTERVHQQMLVEGAASRHESRELQELVVAAKQRLLVIGEKAEDLADQKALTAHLIRDIVETGLRPLSQRLWQQENSKVLNFSFIDLAKLSVVGQPVAIWPSAFIYFLGAFATLAAHIEPEIALPRALVGTAIMCAVFALARFVHVASTVAAWVRFFLANALATFAVVQLTDFWFGTIAGWSSTGTVITVFIWMAEVTFLSGLFSTAVENHARVRAQLEQILTKQGVEFAVAKAQTRLKNRDLANYLHGSVQNRLLSAALRIETGKGDASDLVEELRAVESLLDGAANGVEESAGLNLQQQLDELSGRWVGYVVINFDLDSTGYGEKADRQIVEVVNEAISNAVRHGLATKLDVTVRAQPDGAVRLKAIDDGLGPRNGAAGLGSAFFDSVAGVRWSLSSARGGGSVLNVDLPVG